MSQVSGSTAVRFWKPGTSGPGLSKLSEERTISSDVTSPCIVYNPYKNLSIEQQRQKLPVFQYRNQILYLAEKYQTVIIIGETGCGKSTQIPQYLLEAGWATDGHVIGVTQPRRVAAVTLAARIAEEKGVILGDEIGYLIRFDNSYDEEKTRVKFMTDGMMIREIMKDPLLQKYSVILLDEAHERALNTDIILGLLRKIQKKRKDLRLIVASATLDAEEMRNFFNDNDTSDPEKDTAAIMTIEGREFPVDIHYTLDPVPNYIKAAIETVMKIHRNEPPGDIIVFFTGMNEVEEAVYELIGEARKINKNSMKMRVLPMHGSLPSAEQMKIFERSHKNTRKIVVATNIAETSLTIPGITYVVDAGFVKLKAYNPKSGIESLVIVPVSQASANQRAGRAGRVRAGKAYRLYTEESFEKLPLSTTPEMQRSDLAPVILQLKALGVANVLRFHFLSPPPAQNMVRGLELLYALGALDDAGNLTSPLGLQMVEFPLSPQFAKVLLSSEKFGCSEEAIIVCSMTQIQNVFITPSDKKLAAEKDKHKFSVLEGDHLTLVNVYKAFIKNGQSSRWCHDHCLNYKGLNRAVEISNQLGRLLTKFKVKMLSCNDNTEALCKCILSGFFANVAHLHYSGEYRTVRDDVSLHIHPTSVLASQEPPQWVLFNEVIQSKKNFMRDITVIQPEWLTELAPHFYQFGTERELAAKRARLTL
ncbi:probable ATP-dependent RNA helicase DHX35 [Physella acuta]|uniref:probable ATP-dependent RNA helicase DHX35 n=1 Tax=Physella acuta TaxID=109671 RepID=UPI0027DDA60D|nr:probable ATP-dependent RNA helicase DHX35 [Physella acuta]XP_059163533.1 probable ATP-dependent RNA helicase DHX35 [Physella acuta]XP_059163534.1 probable ATP-dependent RNA helicase DHX35 [Physella acuta]XP_059163535.1 probable ATP-dependent RNA helicase DHX35 [Physella acuta]